MKSLKEWISERRNRMEKWENFVREHQDEFDELVIPHQRYSEKLLWLWLGGYMGMALIYVVLIDGILGLPFFIDLPILIGIVIVITAIFVHKAKPIAETSIKNTESLKKKYHYE